MPGATQNFVQFDHIRNGVVVLKNGDIRGILEVYAMNFGLKSVDEQEAIIYAFQNFMNSLDFDLQIVVHSRRMDIAPYLQDLESRAQMQENPLLRQQTEEYAAFIRSFVEETNVMAKRFFVVVPFSIVQGANKSGGFGSALSTMFNAKSRIVKIDEEHFKAAKTQLLQRMEFVSQNLEQVGLSSTALGTEDLLRLFWEIYNPERRESGDYMPSDVAMFASDETEAFQEANLA